MAKLTRPSNSLLKELADDIFSIDRRIECAILTTGKRDVCKCVTCGKQYPTFGMGNTQLGHFILRVFLKLRYSRQNTHGQCFHCNSTYMNGKKGEQYRHGLAIDRMYGDGTARSLMEMEEEYNRTPVHEKDKWRAWDYCDVILDSYQRISEYKKKYDIVLPASGDKILKKAYKVLSSLTRDDKYIVDNIL